MTGAHGAVHPLRIRRRVALRVHLSAAGRAGAPASAAGPASRRAGSAGRPSSASAAGSSFLHAVAIAGIIVVISAVFGSAAGIGVTGRQRAGAGSATAGGLTSSVGVPSIPIPEHRAAATAHLLVHAVAEAGLFAAVPSRRAAHGLSHRSVRRGRGRGGLRSPLHRGTGAATLPGPCAHPGVKAVCGPTPRAGAALAAEWTGVARGRLDVLGPLLEVGCVLHVDAFRLVRHVPLLVRRGHLGRQHRHGPGRSSRQKQPGRIFSRCFSSSSISRSAARAAGVLDDNFFLLRIIRLDGVIALGSAFVTAAMIQS